MRKKVQPLNSRVVTISGIYIDFRELCCYYLFPTLTLSQEQEFQQMSDFTAPSTDTFGPDNLYSLLSSPMTLDVPKLPPKPPSQTRKPQLPPKGVRRGDTVLGKVSSLDQPLPPVPTNNPRANVVSTDSGIGPSPPSSSTTAISKSDVRKFDRDLGVQVEEEGDQEELENYGWFWGCMSRQDCEKKLQSEGKVGNFVVRINARGYYIMSFWYVWEVAVVTMNIVL